MSKGQPAKITYFVELGFFFFYRRQMFSFPCECVEEMAVKALVSLKKLLRKDQNCLCKE